MDTESQTHQILILCSRCKKGDDSMSDKKEVVYEKPIIEILDGKANEQLLAMFMV